MVYTKYCFSISLTKAKYQNRAMLKSTKQIFETAKACFFQHGYTASSIAMISRYAKVSRVTIHKQFESKEVLFRASVQNVLLEKDIEIQKYVNSSGLFWADTYQFLSDRCREVFEDIPSAMIKADLVHAGRAFCSDLLDENRIKTRLAIQTKLHKAVDLEQVSLDKLGLSIETFAANIETIGEALMLSSASIDPRKSLQSTLHVFDVASRT